VDDLGILKALLGWINKGDQVICDSHNDNVVAFIIGPRRAIIWYQ
jgi:hypothetical protein